MESLSDIDHLEPREKGTLTQSDIRGLGGADILRLTHGSNPTILSSTPPLYLKIIHILLYDSISYISRKQIPTKMPLWEGDIP